MRARSSLTQKQREQLVDYFEQGLGAQALATLMGVHRDSVRVLHRRWKLHGRLCLVEKPTKQTYSFETKKQVVDRFNAGESMMELAAEFQLSSDQLVTGWVRAWRQGGDEALMPKPKGRPKKSVEPTPESEEDKLRRELRLLKAENAYLKKLRDLRNQGHV